MGCQLLNNATSCQEQGFHDPGWKAALTQVWKCNNPGLSVVWKHPKEIWLRKNYEMKPFSSSLSWWKHLWASVWLVWFDSKKDRRFKECKIYSLFSSLYFSNNFFFNNKTQDSRELIMQHVLQLYGFNWFHSVFLWE